MSKWPVHGKITGPIVLIGFGSIGRGILPLIERHFEFDKSRFTVIDPDDTHRPLLDVRGIDFIKTKLTPENYREVLTPLVTKGEGQGFIVNLSVEVSSLDMIKLARELKVLYVDTVVEPWPGFYFDKSKGNEARTNYALRETVLEERRKNPGGTTAISCCGANPGMVSWFVKQALVNLAKDTRRVFTKEPATRAEWGALAQQLGVKGVHIAERDTQRAGTRSRATSSSTPGRSKASFRKGCSRPSSAGARMRRLCRTLPARIIPAAAPRSICFRPAPIRACAPGRRRRVRNMASSSRIMNRFRSPII